MVYKIKEFEKFASDDDLIIAHRRLGRLIRSSLDLQGPDGRRPGMTNAKAIDMLRNVWSSKMTQASLGRYIHGTITGGVKEETLQQLGSLCFKPSTWTVSGSDPIGRPVFSPDIRRYDQEKMFSAIYADTFAKLPDAKYRMTYEDVIQFMLHPPIAHKSGEYHDHFSRGKQLMLA